MKTKLPQTKRRSFNSQQINRQRQLLSKARILSVRKSVCKLASLDTSEAPLRIAIVRSLGGLGDVLMVTSALRGLREKFPKARIHYVVPHYGQETYMDTVKGLPYVDAVMPFEELVQSHYDYVEDVTSVDVMLETASVNAKKPPPSRIDIYCNFLKVNPVNRLPWYQVTPEEDTWAKETIFNEFGTLDNLLFLNHQSNDNRRNIPIETLREASLQLALEGQKIVLAHWDIDKFWPVHKNILFVKTKIREAAALLNQCSLGFYHDTGIMHIAGALEKKMLVCMGNVPPECRLNYYNNAIVFPVECDRCWYRNCKKNWGCLKSITPNQIVTGIKGRLDGAN